MDKIIKYFLFDDNGAFLIKSNLGAVYTAGYDKQKVERLINMLNDSHRPNILQTELNEILVCWNDHDKSDGCNYIKEI